MSDFFVQHASFARWAVLYLALGAALVLVWSWRFRRLSRRGLAPSELRWEAWGGVAASAGWLLSLALMALLMRTTAEISALDAIAVSDKITPRLVEAVTYGMSLIACPLGVALGGAVLWLLMNGVWSGALAAL